MMTPRRLRGGERVKPGDLVDDGRGGFRPLMGVVGELAGAYSYPVFRKRTLLVLGHGGHGKGEFCRLLSELYGAECLSSSEAALPHIFPALNAALAHDFEGAYTSREQAYNERGGFRPLWKALISLYNTPDKATLAREVLSRAEVYDGMRDAGEFEASRHLFDLVVWVDASERVRSVDPSMGIKCEVAGAVIHNNGTIDDLRGLVEWFGKTEGLIPLTS